MTDRNVFITTYLTRPKMERHPHKNWPTVDFSMLDRLARSVAPYGELIVCADELEQRRIPRDLRDKVTIHRVEHDVDNVYFERWDIVRDVLEQNPDIRFAYACDARDVIVVNDPWDFIEPGTLYTCTEPNTLVVGRRRNRPRIWHGQPLGRSGFITDRSFHPSTTIQGWIKRHPRLVALNAGVVAGDRATVLRFAQHMATHRLAEHVKDDYTDMALFNWIAHQEFNVVGSEEFIGAKCHLADQAPNARVLHVP